MKYLGFCLWFFLLTTAYSQPSINDRLISSSSLHTSPNVKVNWVIGETFSETLSNGLLSLSPGISESNVILVITDVQLTPVQWLITGTPNPFLNKVIINLSEHTTSFQPDHLILTDNTGRVFQIPLQVRGGEIELDTRELVSGVYFLQIKHGSKSSVIKLIKL